MRILPLAVLMLAPVAASAQPLTQAEKNGFAAAVAACWIPETGVDPVVNIRFAMGADGLPDADSFSVVGPADEQAFAAARRAVMRCAGAGYGLPAEKYDAWDNIQMTFTPSGVEGFE